MTRTKWSVARAAVAGATTSRYDLSLLPRYVPDVKAKKQEKTDEKSSMAPLGP